MLNENLDWKANQEAYAERGWVVVSDFLEAGVAEDIRRSLTAEVSWGIYYTGTAPEPVSLTSEAVAGLSMEQKAAIAGEFHARARDQYACFYYHYDLEQAQQTALQAFYQALDGEKLPGFIRYVTGAMGARRGPVTATCFQPSCFIKQQTGLPAGGNGIGFMLGFNPAWTPDFGGLLHLHGRDGACDGVVPPEFNRLVLFPESMSHFVSQVATFTPEFCYWIKGTFV